MRLEPELLSDAGAVELKVMLAQGLASRRERAGASRAETGGDVAELLEALACHGRECAKASNE